MKVPHVRMTIQFDMDPVKLAEHNLTAQDLFQRISMGEDNLVDGFFLTTNVEGLSNEDEYFLRNLKVVTQELDVPAYEPNQLVTALLVEVGKLPRTKEIDPRLESLQDELFGQFEVQYPFSDPVALITKKDTCDLKQNRTLRNSKGRVEEVLHGPFLLVGYDADGFTSLNKTLIRKYREKFKSPQFAIWHGENFITFNYSLDSPDTSD